MGMGRDSLWLVILAKAGIQCLSRRWQAKNYAARVGPW